MTWTLQAIGQCVAFKNDQILYCKVNIRGKDMKKCEIKVYMTDSLVISDTAARGTP